MHVVVEIVYFYKNLETGNACRYVLKIELYIEWDEIQCIQSGFYLCLLCKLLRNGTEIKRRKHRFGVALP